MIKSDLIQELKGQRLMVKGEFEIFNDIEENGKKINQQGKRAEAERQGVSLDTYPVLENYTTQHLGNKIEISVKDSGPGLSNHVIDKIFQHLPDHIFGAGIFITKPTGQETGLGPSLSYDIIKALGGEVILESIGKVKSYESKESKFNIHLPVG